MINQLIFQYQLIFSSFFALFKNVIFFVYNHQKVFSNSDSFQVNEYVQNGQKIKVLYQDFLKKIGLRDDVYLIEYPHPMCFSMGYNVTFSKASHAAIFMSQGFFELDRDAFSFLLKHECSHIKFSDTLMRSVVSLLTVGLLTFLSSYFLKTSLVIYLFFTLIPFTNYLLGGYWMHYREYRADQFAIAHGHLEELKGAVCYFTAIKKYNAELAPTHPQYTSDGELANGFHYPKTAKRIQRLLQEIVNRSGSTYEPQADRINKHIELLKKNDAALKAIVSEPV